MSDRNRGYLYLPWIDGMRAVTVFAVILYGGGFLPVLKGGYAGADIFFVLSGYVISHSQTRSVMSSGKDPGFFRFTGAFYLRRLLRLIPSLAACLFLTSAAAALISPDPLLSPPARGTGLSALGGMSPVFLALSGTDFFSSLGGMNPFLHTWFAGVMFSFYLIFPLAFYFWLFGGKRGPAVFVLSRILIPLVFLGSLAYAAFGTRGEYLFYLLPGRLWEMGLGAMLFFLQTRWQFLSGGRAGGANLLLPVGLLIIGAGFFLLPPGPPFPRALVPAGGTLLVLWGMGEGADKLTPAHDFLGSPLLVHWGRRAYSLYLWHWPVIVFMGELTGLDSLADRAATFVLILFVASLSYHLIERPGRFIIASGRRRFLPLLAVILVLLYGGTAFLLLP